MHKNGTACNESGQPIHSFRSLLADLGTIAYNIVAPASAPSHTFVAVTDPTPRRSTIAGSPSFHICSLTLRVVPRLLVRGT